MEYETVASVLYSSCGLFAKGVFRPTTKVRSFEYESIQDNETVIKYLKALADGFQKGKITLSSDYKTIDLFPNNLMKLSIKAGKKSDKSKFSLKISWKDTADIAEDNDIRIETQ